MSRQPQQATMGMYETCSAFMVRFARRCPVVFTQVPAAACIALLGSTILLHPAAKRWHLQCLCATMYICTSKPEFLAHALSWSFFRS